MFNTTTGWGTIRDPPPRQWLVIRAQCRFLTAPRTATSLDRNQSDLESSSPPCERNPL